MDQQYTPSSTGANGHSAANDLFALTDEQILEIAPEASPTATVEQPLLAVQAPPQVDASPTSTSAISQRPNEAMGQDAQAGMPTPPEPPPWLAAQMKDPWSGDEARELWNGVVQARQEAGAYRAAIASPEDARALKELYPGGVNEARAAAERARALDEIDRAYFGASGGTPEAASAARVELAQRMLREDPAAFREMVFAGLRALEQSGQPVAQKSVAQAFRPEGASSPAAPTPTDGKSTNGNTTDGKTLAPEGASYTNAHAATAAGAPAATANHAAHVAAYAAFEKLANEDLEKSVGGAIERTLHQALPNAGRMENAASTSRLAATIRQDVEKALQNDRQLGEQVAQVLAGRRLDNEARAQVVRLINDRARHLVPSAAKRVLSDWTQTTFAAHRGSSARADAASARREVAPVHAGGLPAGSAANTSPGKSSDPNRGATRMDSRRVDYRKLSDEQILDF